MKELDREKELCERTGGRGWINYGPSGVRINDDDKSSNWVDNKCYGGNDNDDDDDDDEEKDEEDEERRRKREERGGGRRRKKRKTTTTTSVRMSRVMATRTITIMPMVTTHGRFN